MLAIISDIHGNLPALESVLKEIGKLGCDKIISLGDVVGYYTQPHECIQLLKKFNVLNILGNHDKYLLNDCVCSRSNYVSEILKNHKKLLTSEDIDWLSKSLEYFIYDNCYFVHGGINDFQEEYLYTVSKNNLPSVEKIMFSGHTHVQALFKFKDKQYCNPGSVGQPRDGNSKAAFATIDNGIITLHRVDYDIDKIAYEMKKKGYPLHYYQNLYHGTQIGGRIDKIKQIEEK